MMKKEGNKLNETETQKLFQILKTRFKSNNIVHPEINWDVIQKRLEANPKILRIIWNMEETGGEPDIIAYDKKSGVITVTDCSVESPLGRRSLCYDQAALDARKENKPSGNVIETAKEIGIKLLDESQYRHLQTLGQFDQKTSSWVLTSPEIRKLDGALFCDRRYNKVFLYHNGASSYYAARGFRGYVEI